MATTHSFSERTVSGSRSAAAGRLRRRLRSRRLRERLVALTCVLSGLVVGQLIGPLPGLRPTPPSATSTDPATASRIPGEHPPRRADAGSPAPGQRAVALIRPLALPPLVPGDRVELVSVTVDAMGSAAGQFVGTRPVTVLTIASDTITVAVPADDVIALLEHQARGTIEVVAVP